MDKRKNGFSCQKPADVQIHFETNKNVEAQLRELEKYYSTTGDTWRSFGYRKAANYISKLTEQLDKNNFRRLIEGKKGIGEKILRKIYEMLDCRDEDSLNVCHRLKFVRQDEGVREREAISSVWGIGSSTAQKLHAIGINSISKLREAVEQRKVCLTAAQMIGLKYVEDLSLKMERWEAHRYYYWIRKIVSTEEPFKSQILASHICGSFRRGKSLCGDVDILLIRRDDQRQGDLLDLLVRRLHVLGLLTDDLAHIVTDRDQQVTENVVKVASLSSELKKDESKEEETNTVEVKTSFSPPVVNRKQQQTSDRQKYSLFSASSSHLKALQAFQKAESLPSLSSFKNCQSLIEEELNNDIINPIAKPSHSQSEQTAHEPLTKTKTITDTSPSLSVKQTGEGFLSLLIGTAERIAPAASFVKDRLEKSIQEEKDESEAMWLFERRFRSKSELNLDTSLPKLESTLKPAEEQRLLETNKVNCVVEEDVDHSDESFSIFNVIDDILDVKNVPDSEARSQKKEDPPKPDQPNVTLTEVKGEIDDAVEPQTDVLSLIFGDKQQQLAKLEHFSSSSSSCCVLKPSSSLELLSPPPKSEATKLFGEIAQDVEDDAIEMRDRGIKRDIAILDSLSPVKDLKEWKTEKNVANNCEVLYDAGDCQKFLFSREFTKRAKSINHPDGEASRPEPYGPEQTYFGVASTPPGWKGEEEQGETPVGRIGRGETSLGEEEKESWRIAREENVVKCLDGTEMKRVHRRIDIKIYPQSSEAFALLYFTGSAIFNRSMRLYAKKLSLSLDDHGLFPTQRVNKKRIWMGPSFKASTEKEIFDIMKLDYLTPSERDVGTKI
eukprot:GDKJ01025393.1.p1 GENE.GDKJ01025393.1~~GDKJ01025393.1.p1  ORF type:complete len:882 (-),score=178.85 GDKJ01025393.1:84-2594(-)